MASRLRVVDAATVSRVSESGNLLIRGLSISDRKLLEVGAERLLLRRGTRLHEGGDALDAAYFPETTLLAVAEGEARHAEVAVVGREGFAGWSLVLGSCNASHSVAVSTRDGSVLRIRRRAFEVALAQSRTLQRALLPFVEVLTIQMSTSILSGSHDHIEVRIARWLLMRHDRVGGDELLVRHDEIADSLGVRRASVTDILHVLEGQSMVRCRRGRILIRDRGRLEHMAAKSYGAPEARYRALIGPFGK